MIEHSELEIWLRKRNMSNNRFCELIGCTRFVSWKVKKGIPISYKNAKKIYDMTEGEVKPIITKIEKI